MPFQFLPGDRVRIRGQSGILTVGSVTPDLIDLYSVRTLNSGDDVKSIDTYQIVPGALVLVGRDTVAEDVYDILVALGCKVTLDQVKELTRGKAANDRG